jgi:DNA-binding transcriptional ArsR family regulator
MGKEVNDKDNPEIMGEGICFLDIRTKLDAIHQEVRRIREKSNQEHIDHILSNTRKDFSNSIAVYVTDDIETDLERGMAEECHLRKTCKPLFKNFLEKNMVLIRQGHDPEIDNIEENKAELNEMRNGAPFEDCKSCYDEVSSLFDKQLKLIQSLQIYKTNESQKQELSPLSEDLIVKDVLEPLSNKQRLQILQTMASETKTYSELSEITGLRGGNLLFHLQKLQDSELILQRHERGDYMITKKGFSLLLILNNIQDFLQNVSNDPNKQI